MKNLQQEIQPSSVVFAEEDFWTVKAEIGPLLQEQYDEVDVNKGTFELNPDWDKYESVYLVGNLGVYTARLEGKLIGYFIAIADRHMHYKDYVFAVNDIIFIHKNYRKSMLGAGLMRFVEEDLKAKGVAMLTINTKVHKPFDNLMEHLGYTLTERVYTKNIGA